MLKDTLNHLKYIVKFIMEPINNCWVQLHKITRIIFQLKLLFFSLVLLVSIKRIYILSDTIRSQSKSFNCILLT